MSYVSFSWFWNSGNLYYYWYCYLFTWRLRFFIFCLFVFVFSWRLWREGWLKEMAFLVNQLSHFSMSWKACPLPLGCPIRQKKNLASPSSGLSQSGWTLHMSHDMGLTHFVKGRKLPKYCLIGSGFYFKKITQGTHSLWVWSTTTGLPKSKFWT